MAESMFISLNSAQKWTKGRFTSISMQSFEGQTVVVCFFDTFLTYNLFCSVGIVDNVKNTTKWGDVVQYTTGCSPSVSLVCIGKKLYAVETHESEIWRNCFYRVGVVNVEGKTIGWRKSTCLGHGRKPKVATDSNGTVIVIHEHALSSSMLLHIGEGKWVEQEIGWRANSITVKHFQGTEPNITTSNSKVVIICRARGGRINYMVGTCSDTSVDWGSLESLPRSGGAEFGQYPSISLNSKGNIVESHQTSVLRQLCFSCGRLNTSDIISWTDAAKSDLGEYPSVSLSDNNCFIEVHKTNFGLKLFYRKGKLENC